MAEAKDLYCSVTGTSGIVSASINDDFGQPTRNAMVDCLSTELELGDAVTVDMGYTDEHASLISGYLLEKTKKRTAQGLVTSLRIRDKLWRAMAYFIAAENPEEPLKYSNIASEDLVRAMLQLASVPGPYDLESPGFTFAPEEPLEVQLVSAWDMIAKVTYLIAWHCYDDDGTIRFLDRKPYPMAGDVSIYNFVTGDSGRVLAVEPWAISSDKIRNKVVVYGKEGVYASASASSPFLPDGFYKTEVIAAPDLIDTQQMAQDIADYNLNLLNRLEKTLTLSVVGTPSIKARSTVTVTESETGVSGDWFVYGCSHELTDFYTTRLTLTQRQVA